MTDALEIMSKANILPVSEVQKADREYRELVEKKSALHCMRVYQRSEKRLDSFWMELLSEYPSVAHLQKVVQILVCPAAMLF